jgi:5-methyltetrahydrofolate--homocysteine methyltransferase
LSIGPTPDEITIYDPESLEPLEKVVFPRQQKPPHRSVCDYLLAPAEDGSPVDNLAILVTTAGSKVREQSQAWMREGEYLKSHAIQALAVEMAEGLAERTHRIIRSNWGYPDADSMTRMDLFRAQYRGKRYSFGYPACPRLEDQEQLFRLLEVSENLPVELTEGFMMDPESSVSAMVFHHPDATYFTLTEQDIEKLEREAASS